MYQSQQQWIWREPTFLSSPPRGEPSCHCQKNNTGLHIQSLVWPCGFLLLLSTLNSSPSIAEGPQPVTPETPPLSPLNCPWVLLWQVFRCRGKEALTFTLCSHKCPLSKGITLNYHSSRLIWVKGQLWNHPCHLPLQVRKLAQQSERMCSVSQTWRLAGKEWKAALKAHVLSSTLHVPSKSLDHESDVDETWDKMFSYLRS